LKNILNISFVYIGLVIGAGFASGREIFEYFNIPSQTDLSGIVIAGICFSALAYIVMSISKKNGINTFDDFITFVTPNYSKFIKLFLKVFMFCGYFVMLSASGTLLSDTFDLPFGAGVFILSVICFFVFAFDVSGILFINTIMVPIMSIGMIALCIASSVCGAFEFTDFNSLKTNNLISALCYVSYNTITAGAVLVPVAHKATHRQICHASLISGGVLGVIIFFVWIVLNLNFSAMLNIEMPLLELAAFHGYIYKILYTTILFMALCTTAVSHGFGILSAFHFKSKSDFLLAVAIFCLAAMPFAKLGFSNLISNLYSIFGFVGLLWTFLIIHKFLKPN
jgi:uncharacterized membrane protein YkvI